MKRQTLWGALLVALFAIPTQPARAEKLLDLSGRVALLDGRASKGVTVKLQVDLDRNRELDDFETVTGSVDGDGSYSLTYDLDPADVDFEFVQLALELLAAYEKRGFEALLDQGPLPVFLSFQREGYSTVVKRFTTLTDAPNLDVVLAPLRDIQCAGARCLSADASVQLSGLPAGSGVNRAYAQAYDPGEETPRFPGSFTDDQDNLLQSTGFAEINLHDASGAEIHRLSAPVSVRFEAKRASWYTMPDLEPASGRIELPMYSFDRDIGEWVREPDGELQHADGTPVREDALAMIRQGKIEERLFVAFRTAHFSTFNCDEPIEARACVQGRLVNAQGKPIAGAQVSVNGASYTGSAGASFTGTDGRFASDVMRSERAGEDIDFNGKEGETFKSRVVATGSGVFVGEPFDTPREQGSVQRGAGASCRAPDCDCLELGDITVDFEEPRRCEVTVEVRFSGKHTVGEGGPLVKGDAVASARVRGVLTGELSPPQSSVAVLCQNERCNAGVASEDGKLTFVVPVLGDAPSLQLDADLLVNDGDTSHYYSGSLVVAGCKRGESTLSGALTLEVDHAAMEDLGTFVDALGPSVSSGSNTRDGTDPLGVSDPLGCGCELWNPSTPRAWQSAGALALAILLAIRRRRSRD